MERLLIVVIKLLLKLAWVLFKLVLRLVLFAYSGDWNKLDKLEAQVRAAIEQAKQDPKPAGPPVPRTPRTARAKSRSVRAPSSGPAQHEPWPFEFAPERMELEPEDGEQAGGEYAGGAYAGGEFAGDELLGGELTVEKWGVPRTSSPKRATSSRREVPLALALRDPHFVRDAMVLTAVLGPRGRRARRTDT